MERLLLDHPYLVASLAYVLGLLALARASLPAREGRLTVFGGLVHLPATGFGLMLDDYWWPERSGGALLGIEDVLITFAVASLPVYLFAVRFRGRLTPPCSVPRAVRRSLPAGLAVIGTFLLLLRAGADGMSALLGTCIAGAVVLILRDRRQLGAAAWSAAATAVVWAVLVRITFAVYPGFPTAWTTAAPWGVPVAGLPLGEVAWALAFGAFWPLFILHVFDVEVRMPREVRPRAAPGSVAG